MDVTPVAVIGAGPAGLATARELALRGIRFRLFDRSGEAGGAYRAMHEGMTIASPAHMNGLPGLALKTLGVYATVAEYRAYLADYAKAHSLFPERGTVLSVERAGDVFELRIDTTAIRARSVVVATGMWDFPRTLLLDAGDIPRIHARDWQGVAARTEARILLVGGGTSAVEIAEEIAGARDRVWISARSGIHIVPRRVLGRDTHDWFRPIERALPRWLTGSWCAAPKTHPASGDSFAALRKLGRIDVRPAIAGISGARVEFHDGSAIDVDLIVTATGFHFETPFLPSDVERAPGGHLRARGGESVSWPGLFVVGAPCSSNLDSEFLRGIARDAPRVAARIAERQSLPI